MKTLSSTPIEIDVLVVIRETVSGGHVAFPVADPSLISLGSESSCLDELRLFLGEHLAELPGTEVYRFVAPEGAELHSVEVEIPRDDLPRRAAQPPPIEIPCVVIPAGRAVWVVALPLEHTFYVGDAGQWRDKAQQEISRIAAAREMTPTEYLEILPGLGRHLERLAVQISAAKQEEGAADAKTRSEAHRRKAALELLGKIGDPPGPARRSGLAKAVAPVEREDLLKTLRTLLSGDQRLSVLVTGRELVGKTAVIEAALADRGRVFVTSGARLMAGQSLFGQWQQQVHDVMRAAEWVDAVLYFDNLADLFASRGGSDDMAGLMRPYLESRRVRLVAEASPELADVASRSHVGFFSQLHPVRVEPLGVEATRRVVEAHVASRRKRQPEAPNLVPEAIAVLVDLAERYLPYRAFPGKAVRLYEELLAAHTDGSREAGPKQALTTAEVHESVSLRTGIPSFLLRDDRALKFDEIVRAFRQRIIGQHEAVSRVAQTLCTVKAGLQPSGRPLANFLFVGPTGVGKTEVAKTLSRFLFGSEDRLLRYDMSEYMDAWASERLIRGSDREEGLLTRRIRQQPFSVLLLDEIEKAHSAVFDLLLQVMGDGRLTDAKGRTSYFHNAILIMTSNLGVAHRRKSLGFDDEGTSASSTQSHEKQYYQEQVDQHFRPEFVNRLDRVIAFEALTPGEVGEIGKIAAGQLANRHGLVDRGIGLDVGEGVLTDLASAAHDPAYGARQLHRHLDRQLVAPLTRLLSRLGTRAAGTTIEVTRSREPIQDEEILDDGNLRFAVLHHASGKPRAPLGAIQTIAEMRREAQARFDGERLEEIRVDLETLTTQMAQGQKRGKKRIASADMARMRTEYHRLRQIQDRLDGLKQDLDDVEEVAISALFEGEAIEPFLEQADLLYRGWRAALPYALVALEERRDQICLVATELDRFRALDLWLVPLLATASERGWTISGHLHPDPEGVSKKAWGPEKTAAELTEALAAHDRRHGRALLRARGPFAGIFLATEAGVHQYRHVPECDKDEIHLRIERLVWKAELSDKDLKRASGWLIGAPPSITGKIHPMRSFDFHTGQVSLADGDCALELAFEEYWPRFDEVVCEHLLLYEDDPERDRDRELLSSRWKVEGRVE